MVRGLNYLRNQLAFQKHPWRTVWRLAVFRLRCWLNLPVVVTLPVWNIRLFLPAKWRGIQKLIYVFLDYEPELALLRAFLSPGKVFVDVGAYLGIYSTVASKLVGETGRVLAFEPSLDVLEALETNVKLNRAEKVISIFPVALSDRIGRAPLFHHQDPCRNSLECTTEPNGEEVVVVEPLDERLARENISGVDMIKIDVEGAEEMVLRGASRTLQRFKPVVLFEMLDPKANGAWKVLQEQGYNLYHLDKETAALVSLSSPKAGGNFLAISEI